VVWHTQDSLEYMKKCKNDKFDLVLADPPYSQMDLINSSIKEARRICKGPSIYFMYPEDCVSLEICPDQICHWVKPISTKNTKRRYSRFVEAICFYDLDSFSNMLHWSARSGVFTDSLITVSTHPFQKPESLIEKLLLNHSSEGDLILDPFAGSGTVSHVCARLDRRVVSVELDSQWRP
jgi:16S rRNA G966 N2-methylase RsmD